MISLMNSRYIGAERPGTRSGSGDLSHERTTSVARIIILSDENLPFGRRIGAAETGPFWACGHRR
jgi:hypothetical protein